MTEEQIERAAERKMDMLDRQFTAASSNMTQAFYDRKVREIEEWVNQQRRASK